MYHVAILKILLSTSAENFFCLNKKKANDEYENTRNASAIKKNNMKISQQKS